MSDPFDLQRFLAAQAPVHEQALVELHEGRKRSHWMWFVFPQLRGLGSSEMARHYGLSGLAEARAYLAHPVLGARLAACTDAVLAVEGRTLHAIFGSPDDLKFISSMTLFSLASGNGSNPFAEAIDRLCGGSADQRTLALLRERGDLTPAPHRPGAAPSGG
ncbi:MAG: DUF1810 domain-containing protein [Bosea sp. (in: a-proteobacteria)]|uniref:DUF1810 domain-containing protein n=1 Tax=Bosea sp. (in: a-proteobacteria) TaxID=1871050 RepID=UPI00273665EC|nr:DUF1810 domain-containing protein [Bosea sp. (in: a-proteobacteria)]MDP3255487.1 DUF1810 domain-containing protein [Bosea sp. (in: a-proteobacteria)]MDP3319541.1 DUF1810 domain-containing protein [Bosea sp. (in: a-proteobacteria)]